LDTSDKNGVTKREHLKQVERQLGRRPKDLEPPCEFPHLMVHVWVAFCALSNGRSSGMGIGSISFTEIKNWMDITENKLRPREIDIINRLDQTYRKVANG
jgi:hypothetical protein